MIIYCYNLYAVILSHKYKFIFIRPRKVGSSSVGVALNGVLGKDDIATPEDEYNEEVDTTQYRHTPRNYKGFYNHMKPIEIMSKIPSKTWNSYTKFTIVRNPWDMMVSAYYWELQKEGFRLDMFIKNLKIRYDRGELLNYLISKFKKRKYVLPTYEIKSFEDFIRHLPKDYINTDYYFDKQGSPVADVYLKTETLQQDLDRLTDSLDIPNVKLPRLKSKVRKTKIHYSNLYTHEMKDKVAKAFTKEIEYFGYEF